VTLAELSLRIRRADFLDGLGIYVGAHEVALAHVVKRFFSIALRQARTFPLPPSTRAPERRQALAQAVATFAGEHRVDTRRAFLCLPRAQAACNRILLPAAAQENLEQVLEYEMENLVPLPREEIFFDYTVRPLGAERIEVLLVCVPRDVINGYLAALDEAGVKPRSIGLPSTALADYVTFCRGDVAPGMGVVVQATDATEIALFSQGRLVASQLVPAPNASEPAVLQRSLQRQLADELFEPEQTTLYRWSLANGHAPAVDELGEANLVQMAKGRLATGDAEFAPATPAILPAVGAGLGAVREGVVRLNLLPAEQREAFDEGPLVATWVLLALSLVLLIAWGGMAIVKDGMLRREVQAKLAAIQPDVDEVMALTDENEHLQRQVEILNAQEGRVTTLLKELTDLIPSDAYLTTLNLRGGRLTLDGQARSASDIITALEKSKRFKNVTFSSPTTRQGEKERFALTAEVLK